MYNSYWLQNLLAVQQIFFCCLTLEFNAFNFLGSFTRQQFLLFEMKRRKKNQKYLNDSNTSFHCGNGRRPTITGEKVWKEENAEGIEKEEEEEEEERKKEEEE